MAKKIDKQLLPYVWGGGHARCGVADRGQRHELNVGFDCSGSVCAVLGAQGLGFHPGGPTRTSGGLMSWGKPGKGKFLTVYASTIHTFIVFHTKKGDRHWGTGRWGKENDGPGFNPQMHPTANFVARHWPGL